ncbi:MAG: NlpC/P60 family protein [Bacteroidota bacterium]
MRRLYFRLFLTACICSLWSCTSQKRVQRYAHLFEEKTFIPPPISIPSLLPHPKLVRKPLPIVKAIHLSPAVVEVPLTPVLDMETHLVVQTAMSYRGVPYRYGGMSKTGIDCSGLICRAYQAVDRPLPHSSRILLKQGTQVLKDQLRPGHLVFFSGKNGKTIDHVGMVQEVTDGKIAFIHATVSGGVRVDRLDDPYWRVRFRDAVAL